MRLCSSLATMATSGAAATSTTLLQPQVTRCYYSMGQTASLITTKTKSCNADGDGDDHDRDHDHKHDDGNKCNLESVSFVGTTTGANRDFGVVDEHGCMSFAKNVGHIVYDEPSYVYNAHSVTGTVHVEVGDGNQDGWWAGGARSGYWSAFAVGDAHGERGAEVKRVVGPRIVCGILTRLEGFGIEASVEHVENVVEEVWRKVGKDVDTLDWAVESGTTFTVCVLGGDICVVANAGDSNAVLARRYVVDKGGGEQEQRLHGVLACPVHRVSNVEERRRVEGAGARVYGQYVKGDDHIMTSVTRSFGDLELRHLGIIDTPSVTRWSLTGKEEFLILATDGLWDAYEGDITPQVAADMVARHKLIYGRSRKSASEMLCRRAGSPGPLDDCTVLVVFLK